MITFFRHAKYDATKVASIKIKWSQTSTYTTMMELMSKNFEGWVNKVTATNVRDFVMVTIIIGGSGPRGEAICNLTIPELESAEQEGDYRVAYVKDHKTDNDGPVALPIPNPIYDMTRYIGFVV